MRIVSTSKLCLLCVLKISVLVCFYVTSHALTCVGKKHLSLRCVPLVIVGPYAFHSLRKIQHSPSQCSKYQVTSESWGVFSLFRKH